MPRAVRASCYEIGIAVIQKNEPVCFGRGKSATVLLKLVDTVAICGALVDFRDYGIITESTNYSGDGSGARSIPVLAR